MNEAENAKLHAEMKERAQAADKKDGGTKPKAKKARQIRIPSMEPATIKVLEECAADYVDIRDQRMALTKQEVELKAKLMAAMQENEDALECDADGNRYYKCRDSVEPTYTVVLEHKQDNVKVKKDADDSEGAGGDGE